MNSTSVTFDKSRASMAGGTAGHFRTSTCFPTLNKFFKAKDNVIFTVKHLTL